jgi:hypothetical protein
MSNLPDSQANSDALLLRRLKRAIAVVVVLFTLQILAPRGIPEIWPLTRWEMYANPLDVPGDTVETDQLRVIDKAGVEHIYPVSILYTSVGTPDSASGRVIRAAFSTEDNSDRAALRVHVLDRLHARFPNFDAVEVQLWHLTWHLVSSPVAQFDYAAPDEATMIGSFTSVDVIGAGL